MLFEIYKQKYFEALYRNEKDVALDILRREFRSIISADQDVYKELTLLFKLQDFRQHPQLMGWNNPQNARAALCSKMRDLVLKCPVLEDKLHFPIIPRSRLSTLVTQNPHWGRYLHERAMSNAVMTTIVGDCNHSELMPPPLSMSPSVVPRQEQNIMPLPSSLPTVLTHSAAGPSRSILDVRASPQRAIMCQDSHSSDLMVPAKRLCASGPSISAEQSTCQIRVQISTDGLQKSHTKEDLPTTLVMALLVGSSVVSIDFNPVQQTILLGEISIWDLSSRERIHRESFGIRNNPALSAALQDAIDKENGFFSIRRVVWTTDGCFFAVAFCQHLVQMYRFSGKSNLTSQFEIDAHNGGINDIAFSQPIKKMFVVTGGDDGAIRVWSAVSGLLVHTFVANHSKPVISICARSQYILSASSDGRIQSWRYDKPEPEHEFQGPVCSSVSFIAATGGSRLFSCGTMKDKSRSSFLMEWNEPHESVIRCYSGLSSHRDGALQFDMAGDCILAVGVDSRVKFWNVDQSVPLASIDAEGGLPRFPRVKFNKSGSILAVTADGNLAIKILASERGKAMLSPSDQPSTARTSSNMDDAGTSCTATVPFIGPMTSAAIAEPECDVGTSKSEKETVAPMTPILVLDQESNGEDLAARNNAMCLNEIDEPSQCLSLRLPDMSLAGKVHKLVYTNGGDAILALASNGINKLWRWDKTCLNPFSKATARDPPIYSMPSDGLLINEVGPIDLEAHSFALSKDDKYLISASGGPVSLFSIGDSQKLGSFLRPPSIASVFTFHPDNSNRVAIGMNDSTILIYEPQRKKVCHILNGHKKRVTGLSFSTKLNVLVSSGVDARLCIWNMETWKNEKTVRMELNQEGVNLAHIGVEFHPDQVHLLVVHATQLRMYNAREMEQVHQWSPNDMMIFSSAYSCDGEMVYACMTNKTVIVLTRNLHTKFRINPGVYFSAERLNVYPVVAAAHPSQPTQFAIGMSDGGVQIFEPLTSDGQWGTMPLVPQIGANNPA
ncbi:Topless-related 1-like protein [Rhynchospora pubera]|uniref:Topless-related 1-like protein n=1 Tax=Rhynchospora pubera TaxID=906938 RepID=A0AAV8CHD0_9POAL|nr:Topless-related 1-like protein [Rhynchospora pubera]